MPIVALTTISRSSEPQVPSLEILSVHGRVIKNPWSISRRGLVFCSREGRTARRAPRRLTSGLESNHEEREGAAQLDPARWETKSNARQRRSDPHQPTYTCTPTIRKRRLVSKNEHTNIYKKKERPIKIHLREKKTTKKGNTFNETISVQLGATAILAKSGLRQGEHPGNFPPCATGVAALNSNNKKKSRATRHTGSKLTHRLGLSLLLSLPRPCVWLLHTHDPVFTDFAFSNCQFCIPYSICRPFLSILPLPPRQFCVLPRPVSFLALFPSRNASPWLLRERP